MFHVDVDVDVADARREAFLGYAHVGHQPVKVGVDLALNLPAPVHQARGLDRGQSIGQGRVAEEVVQLDRGQWEYQQRGEGPDRAERIGVEGHSPGIGAVPVRVGKAQVGVRPNCRPSGYVPP